MANIVLTGAAGLIGGEVAARLVARGHRVTALVHKAVGVLSNGARPVQGIHLVKGDISATRLGLSARDHAALAMDNDLIVHCAATTRFDLAERDYQAINTGGTANVLELARVGNVAFLHVSTAYVCGERNDAILEDEPLPTSGFVNGYEASKAAAERLVMASGLHYAIARPSIVVGDSRDGEIRTFGPMYQLFKLLVEGRLKMIPARQTATLDLVAIDHVAAGIVELVEGIEAASGAYHLVSGSPAGVPEAVAMLAGYAHLRMPELIEPDAFDPAKLSLLERWAYKHALSHYAHYFRRHPRFDDSRFRRFSGRTPPVADQAFLRRLIDYSIRAGFVKDRPA